jgi:ABC-type multidrug transport system permease subunit
VKLTRIIGKDLKLLFRSKETAFTIFFGPLLIILLVSAAYTGGSETLSVGTYAPNYTPLVDTVIRSLNAQDYKVSTFTNETQCVERVKSAQLHACILFPEDFRIKQNDTNVVTFAVDYSRVNLVYRMLEGLRSELNLQSENITEGVATDLLERVATAQQEVHEQLLISADIDKLQTTAAQRSSSASSVLTSVNTSIIFSGIPAIKGGVSGLGALIGTMQQEAEAALFNTSDTLEGIRKRCDNCSPEVDALLLDTLERIDNSSTRLALLGEDGPQAVREVNWLVEDTEKTLTEMQLRFVELANASHEADAQLREGSEALSQASAKLTTVRGTLQHVESILKESRTLSAQSVASPITMRITAVHAEQSKLAFTYPYLLMLVIMFLGLMLGSALIVMDKTSTAAFRNFTTATRDEYAVLMSFLSTFLILFGQALVILSLSSFFITTPLFVNFGVTLLIIVVAITLFAFLGMVLGYMSTTQEAAMIASLTLGSILLFISNLVLPLEAMNKAVQALSVYNPYVVLSELLRQSMLFGLRLQQVPEKIGLLLLAIVALFALIILVQRSFKRRFFLRRSKDLDTRAFTPKTVRPLQLTNREVRDLFDLLSALDAMTRAEFEQAIAGERNPVAAWVKNEMKEKRLARKLDTRNKELMILALDKHLKKKSRKLAEER